MTGNIVDLSAHRRSVLEVPPDPLDTYTVQIHRTGPQVGEILGFKRLSPEQQRRIVNDLIDMTRSLVISAYEQDGDNAHNVVAEFRIMASGRMLSWTSPQVDTTDKLDWLHRIVGCLGDAVPTIPPTGAP